MQRTTPVVAQFDPITSGVWTRSSHCWIERSHCAVVGRVKNPASIRSRLLTVAAVLVVALVLYVLSVGPAAYFATRSDILLSPFEKLYLPLIVASRWASLHPFLERYVNWWEALNSN